jgi:hypothetical protein
MENINLGLNGSTTKDWLRISEGMILTAYDPSLTAQGESQMIEPGPAVNLPAADRVRMNRAKPGIHTPPERL